MQPRAPIFHWLKAFSSNLIIPLTMDRSSGRLREPIGKTSEPPLLPHYSPNGPFRRTSTILWLRRLLFISVLYICGLVTFFMSTWPSNVLPRDDILDASSKSQSYTTTVEQAEKHARNVKMLPQGQTRLRQLECIGWKATDNCSPYGPRLPHLDKPCHMLVEHTESGYCEVEDKTTRERFRVMRRYCKSVQPDSQFRCLDAQDFVNFPIQANRALSKAFVPSFALPNAGTGTQGSKGIVMVVYPRIVPSAYASIRALKELLRCDLLIELWYRKEEIHKVPGSMTPLQQLALVHGGISFHEIHDKKAVGFGAKVFAIYHSYFDNVLFLDSDNVPVRDPSFLFETQEFKDNGALFWPDFWHPRHTIFNVHGQSLLWELVDQQFVNMFEQESGQLVIDRRRHAAPLELVKFYAFHTPNFFETYKMVHGDKDLFRLAWLKLKSTFHMIDAPPAVAGKAFNNSFCGMTMVQHDANGEILFLHRNTRKLIGESKRPTTDQKVLGALRGEQTLLYTRPSMEHIEEGHSDIPALTLDAPESDGYPDAIYWTHLLCFRNTSKRTRYIIDVHQDVEGFTEGQSCYGMVDMAEKKKKTHFFFQAFADFSFSGLETHLRKFAMEAAQMIHAHQDTIATQNSQD